MCVWIVLVGHVCWMYTHDVYVFELYELDIYN